jgi:hypothetical protein
LQTLLTDSFRQAETEGADYPAAHADTVNRAEKTEYESRSQALG